MDPCLKVLALYFNDEVQFKAQERWNAEADAPNQWSALSYEERYALCDAERTRLMGARGAWCRQEQEAFKGILVSMTDGL